MNRGREEKELLQGKFFDCDLDYVCLYSRFG